MPLGSSSAAPVINPGPSFFSSGTWLRSFSFSSPWPLEEVHLRRPEEADQAKREAAHAERAGEPDQGRYAGDDRRRGEHDGDLHRRGGQLVAVVGGHRGVALLLGFLGARGELLAALAGLGLRLVALRRFFPRFDLLFYRFIFYGPLRFQFLGRGAQHRLPDGLRLEEGPLVGTFDVVGEGRRLRDRKSVV